MLGSSPRFKNVKGPLYHPVTGWNVGYRVMSQDLMTPIPLEPYEEIHDKPDIPFGTPIAQNEEKTYGKGWTPFTWINLGGARISVNPLNFEIARATAILKLY